MKFELARPDLVAVLCSLRQIHRDVDYTLGGGWEHLASYYKGQRRDRLTDLVADVLGELPLLSAVERSAFRSRRFGLPGLRRGFFVRVDAARLARSVLAWFLDALPAEPDSVDERRMWRDLAFAASWDLGCGHRWRLPRNIDSVEHLHSPLFRPAFDLDRLVHGPAAYPLGEHLPEQPSVVWDAPRGDLQSVHPKGFWLSAHDGVLRRRVPGWHVVGFCRSPVIPRRFGVAFVAVDGSRALLPADRDGDVAEACALLGFTTPEEAVRLVEVCSQSFGFVTKGESVRMVRPGDILEPEQANAVDDRWLWWQRWGGMLYRAEVVDGEPRVERLGSHLGQYGKALVRR